jgi:sn-glycerol 3-phosphate transport system ATP-binding protein
MAVVNLSDVNKTYPNGAHAVRGVSMEISDGELVVFVGPSGCGKSTLLRMVAGLESISQGTVSIEGKVVNDISPADRDVAMVFQNYALYPHMTVRGNMSYGLKNRGDSKAVIKQKVEDAAATLRIEDFLDRQPNQLSGGQRQRVAMGRAIVRNPKVFLFDEPLSNLDAKLRVQMRIEIKRLQRRMGVTAIYVTHDQTEAMTLADRLAVINDGLVEQMGAPIELYNDPQTLFVASFIGSPQINTMPVRFDGQYMTNGPLKLNAPAGLPENTDLVFAIRPEHLSLKQEGQFELKVDLVEQHGAENLIYGTVTGASNGGNDNGGDGGGVVSGSGGLEFCMKVGQEVHPDPDATLAIGFDAAQAFVFDSASGKRLA